MACLHSSYIIRKDVLVYIIPAGPTDEGVHIFRQPGINGDEAMAHGVGELDAVGVQGLAADEAARTAVEVVAGQGIAQVTAVNPDLMGPSRVQDDLEQAVVPTSCEAGEIGPGRLSVEADTAGNDAIGTSSDGGVYSCDPRWVSSLTDG